MASVNVLKKIRARAPVAPKKKYTKQIVKKQTKEFKRAQPYSYFFDKSIEDISESINTIYNMKDYPGHTLLLKILTKVKSKVPMSLLGMFFNIANTDGPSHAFKSIAATQEANEMHNIIINRIPSDIHAYTSLSKPKLHNVPANEEQFNRKLKHLKYTKQDLNKKSIVELKNIILQEGLDPIQTTAKHNLIKYIIDNIPTFTLHRQESLEDKPIYTRFITEIPHRCQSEYKSAPWITRMVNQGRLNIIGKVNGFALRKDSNYTTDFEVLPNSGWFRVKNNWYDHVCANGREYSENSVAYIIRSFNKYSILIETKEIYDESLIPIQIEKPIGLTKAPIVILKHVPKDRENIISQNLPRDVIKLNTDREGNTKYISEELAPGLFNQIKAIISGNITNCASCNVAIGTPRFKSVHGTQKVMFCSGKCLEKYTFGPIKPEESSL